MSTKTLRHEGKTIEWVGFSMLSYIIPPQKQIICNKYSFVVIIVSLTFHIVSDAVVKLVKNIIQPTYLPHNKGLVWIVCSIASLTMDDCEFYCLPISFRLKPFITNLLACHQTSSGCANAWCLSVRSAGMFYYLEKIDTSVWIKVILMYGLEIKWALVFIFSLFFLLYLSGQGDRKYASRF